MRQKPAAWALVFAVGLGGCSSFEHRLQPAPAPTAPHQTRDLVVFFDGTNNDIASDTNVKRLHALTSLQNRKDVATLYVEGVGVGRDVPGMGTGMGLKARVVLAYQFLLENYRRGDRIHLFGFSRGAFQARVLAALLYHAGLPSTSDANRATAAEAIFDAVKTHDNVFTSHRNRQLAVREQLKLNADTPLAPVVVDTLGLWDTVEAMGVPEWPVRIAHKLGGLAPHVNVDAPNQRYGDQLCNVRNAYQALSIDDNREWIFTPLLLSRRHLQADCAEAPLQPEERRIVEVWFSGAHSDVGGGYEDSTLSGNSLNWMIDLLVPTRLVPQGAAVRADPLGTSHNPEAGWWRPLYHAINRNLPGYILAPEHRDDLPTLCVHPSVLQRRQALPPLPHEFDTLPLIQAGVHRVVPDGGRDRPPRWRLSKGNEPGEKAVEVQVWPACRGMTGGAQP